MIIFSFGSIFGAIKEAWHYVGSAVKRGVSSERLSEIITPISSILSPEDIDLYYGLYEDAVENWQRITQIPEEHLIREEFSIKSGFDWREDHIMRMRISGTDINTGELIDSWITVESERELTRGEWLQAGQEAVFDSPFGYSYEIDYVSEYEYYIKG